MQVRTETVECRNSKTMRNYRDCLYLLVTSPVWFYGSVYRFIDISVDLYNCVVCVSSQHVCLCLCSLVDSGRSAVLTLNQPLCEVYICVCLSVLSFIPPVCCIHWFIYWYLCIVICTVRRFVNIYGALCQLTVFSLSTQDLFYFPIVCVCVHVCVCMSVSVFLSLYFCSDLTVLHIR